MKRLILLISVIIIISLSYLITADTPAGTFNFTIPQPMTGTPAGTFNFTLVLTDTCTCAGLDTDWEVDLSDYCVITDNCELGTGTLSFTGTGNFTCDAKINTTNLGDVGNNNIMYIQDDCLINIR